MAYLAGDVNEGIHADIQILIKDLQSKSVDMRWKAARSLGEQGEPAVDALIKNLYHDSPGTRLLAAWALGNTGSRKALPYLERMLDDEDPCARLAVECALQRITRSPHR
ncbi:MAG: PBS lyase HEAT-like repeat protein [Methanoregulaceae archaeon PtaU1.Bin059]|nr:MAG: PBS lyase HEAT-like repeat protein [Methanoregulaceae archaeon PtaU1.Bin059]